MPCSKFSVAQGKFKTQVASVIYPYLYGVLDSLETLCRTQKKKSVFFQILSSHKLPVMIIVPEFNWRDLLLLVNYLSSRY